MFTRVQKDHHAAHRSKPAARKWLIGSLFVVIVASASTIFAGSSLPNPLRTLDRTGVLSTYSTAGGIDLSNPFFQSLGTNGRSCVTCHQPTDGWSVTPEHLRIRFLMSSGNDPIFRPVDGAVCPSADVSSYSAKQAAYSLLLRKGLIRVSMAVPGGADFTIQDIHDPYNCPETNSSAPALYRRPLPSTNLGFLATVMWDGRETLPGQTISNDLGQQAIDATMGHAQASAPPTSDQVANIVSFERALFTAQSFDHNAGMLTDAGATGGPVNLPKQEFYLGINDVLGKDPKGAKFNPAVFNLFNSWVNAAGRNAAARRSVERGQALFNSLPITITGVAGLNDLPGLSTVHGTCTTCHDTPNSGDHSLSLAINIGTTDYPTMPALNISGLPVYTVACSDGSQVQVTDIGRAMVTGKCSDVGKLKGPILRGLAARAPYFHNGGAATLMDVVDFYDERFQLNLKRFQKADLVAFLQTL
jgi:cytochrome c peroxidase